MSLADQIDERALLEVLRSSTGRRVIRDILAIAGIHRIPLVRGDTEGTAFNAGMMNVGQIIYAKAADVSPQLTLLLLQEQFDARSRDKDNTRVNTSNSGSNTDNSGGGNETGRDTEQYGLGFDRYPTATDLGE